MKSRENIRCDETRAESGSVCSSIRRSSRGSQRDLVSSAIAASTIGTISATAKIAAVDVTPARLYDMNAIQQNVVQLRSTISVGTIQAQG